MFAFDADPNPRQNPAGRPLFDLPLAGWLAAGVVFAIARRKSLPHLFGLLWTAVFLLPAALTAEGAPHSLRALGALPGAYLLAVMPMCAVARWIARRQTSWRLWRAPALAVLLPLSFLLYSSFSNLRDYFGAWQGTGKYTASQLAGSFDCVSADAAAALAQQGRADAAWIVPFSRSFFPPSISDFTLDFMYQGKGSHAVVADNELEAPPGWLRGTTWATWSSGRTLRWCRRGLTNTPTLNTSSISCSPSTAAKSAPTRKGLSRSRYTSCRLSLTTRSGRSLCRRRFRSQGKYD
jgi:hypothetical protein